MRVQIQPKTFPEVLIPSSIVILYHDVSLHCLLKAQEFYKTNEGYVTDELFKGARPGHVMERVRVL